MALSVPNTMVGREAPGRYGVICQVVSVVHNGGLTGFMDLQFTTTGTTLRLRRSFEMMSTLMAE